MQLSNSIIDTLNNMTTGKIRKFIFRTMVVILSTFGFFSCSDFLEPKSQSEFIPSTADQLNELLISALTEPNDNTHVGLTGGFLDILTDDIETCGYIPQAPGDAWYGEPYVSAVYSLYTWQPDYSTAMQKVGYPNIDNIYTSIYYKLVYVNSALDYVNKVSGSEEMKNYVKAQALALRAFYYLQLVNVYGVPYNVQPGGPGIPIRTTGAKENRPMLRNTVQEVYDLILSDLNESIDLFETLAPMYQYRQYRPTLPMAMLLLSRAYLYMENWEQAAFYANKLINDFPQFQIKDLNDLIGTYSNVQPDAETTTNQDVRRTQRFYPDFISYNNSDVIWTYGAAADVASITMREFMNATQASVARIQNNNVYATLTLASTDLVGTFDAADLRLRTYFVRSLFNEPDYSQYDFSQSGVKYRAYGKLLIVDNGTGVPNIQNNRFAPQTDARTFGLTLRITEAYLILAEAQAMLGQTADAIQTLENIWQKRFASGKVPAYYSSGNVIDVVRNERRREFCFEDLRWFDLRRWGMPQLNHTWYDVTYGDKQVYVLEQNDPAYTLPMPHTIIAANPDLTQVPLYKDGKNRLPQ